MKKLWIALLISICACLTACNNQRNCKHTLTHHAAVSPTCFTEGNTEFWSCNHCETYFSDAEGQSPITDQTSVTLAASHPALWRFDGTEHWPQFTCEHTEEPAVRTPHTLEDNRCTGCNFDLGSEGLLYKLNADGTAFSLSGIGAANERVRVGNYHSGLPVTAVQNKAFERCDILSEIEFSESITSIGDQAFSFCQNLKAIRIPASVTHIGTDAFMGCDMLSAIEVDSENAVYLGRGNCLIGQESGTLILGCKDSVIPTDGSVKKIEKNAFAYSKSLLAIEIPASVTEIEERAFYSCPNLRAIRIPASVTHIGADAFMGADLLSTIEVDSENAVYLGIGNCLIGRESCTLILGCKDSVIPADGSVKRIGQNAFAYNDGLTAIEIPASVTEIEEHAFESCGQLTQISFAENSTLTTIGASAFSRIGAVAIDLPATVTEIGGSAFAWCRSLERIGFAPDSRLQSIERFTFDYCDKLTAIEIPASVTEIGSRAFADCTSLASVVFADDSQLQKIGAEAFRGCQALTECTIPTGVTEIGEAAFNGCSALIHIALPQGLTSLSWELFKGCTSLTHIILPQSVTEIDFNVCKDCSALTAIYFAGTESEWNAIALHTQNEELLMATVYYYAEQSPTDGGHYWHLSQGVPTPWSV